MTYIIPILTIIIYAIMFAFLFKKRIEQTIPIVPIILITTIKQIIIRQTITVILVIVIMKMA